MKRILLGLVAASAFALSSASGQPPLIGPPRPVTAVTLAAPVAAEATPPKAAASVSLPDTAKVHPGRLLKLTAVTDGKVVKWYLYSDSADLIPFGKDAIFSSPQVGKYFVLCWTAIGDEPSEAAVCIITVEGDVPPPPPPPPPPGPLDAFTQSLQDAYKAVGDAANKAQRLQQLAGLWRTFADVTVNDAQIVTAGQMLSVMAKTTTNLIGNELGPVREAIRKELDIKLPKVPNAPLDAATRTLCHDQFARVASALAQVK